MMESMKKQETDKLRYQAVMILYQKQKRLKTKIFQQEIWRK